MSTPAPGTQVIHELYTEPDVALAEIEVLVRTRWAGAKLDGHSVRVSRYTTIDGPMPVPVHELAALGLPPRLGVKFEVTTVMERGEAPPDWGMDPTGLFRAFPDALPIREELKVAEFLLAAARRLLGAARFAPTGALVSPDPDSATRIDVLTDVWLEPSALQLLVADLHPNALLGTDYALRANPAPEELWVPHVELDEEDRAELHANAAQHDARAHETGHILDGYSVVVDLGEAGLLTVEVTGEEEAPLALADQPWAADGVLTYIVNWLPHHEADTLREFPDPHVAQLRSAMVTLVADIAAVVYQAVGGEILDEDGFLIAPGDL